MKDNSRGSARIATADIYWYTILIMSIESFKTIPKSEENQMLEVGVNKMAQEAAQQKQDAVEQFHKKKGHYDFKIGDKVEYEGEKDLKVAGVFDREPHLEQVSGEGPEEVIKKPTPVIYLEKDGHSWVATGNVDRIQKTPEDSKKKDTEKLKGVRKSLGLE